jgi:hypothetical protein
MSASNIYYRFGEFLHLLYSNSLTGAQSYAFVDDREST